MLHCITQPWRLSRPGCKPTRWMFLNVPFFDLSFWSAISCLAQSQGDRSPRQSYLRRHYVRDDIEQLDLLICRLRSQQFWKQMRWCSGSAKIELDAIHPSMYYSQKAVGATCLGEFDQTGIINFGAISTPAYFESDISAGWRFIWRSIRSSLRRTVYSRWWIDSVLQALEGQPGLHPWVLRLEGARKYVNHTLYPLRYQLGKLYPAQDVIITWTDKNIWSTSITSHIEGAFSIFQKSPALSTRTKYSTTLCNSD